MTSTRQIQPKQCSGTEKIDSKGEFGANIFDAIRNPTEMRPDQQSFHFSVKAHHFLKVGTPMTRQ